MRRRKRSASITSNALLLRSQVDTGHEKTGRKHTLGVWICRESSLRSRSIVRLVHVRRATTSMEHPSKPPPTYLNQASTQRIARYFSACVVAS